MSTAAAIALAPQANFVPSTPDRLRELWVAVPKGGKTLGGDDKAFYRAAGFDAAEQQARIDHYLLMPRESSDALPIRVFEMKPGDAIANIADGLLDAAIVGLDVMKEFNYSSRGIKGRMQAVELVNLDLAPCALAIAVRTGDSAMNPKDLNGRTVVTKYPASVLSWANRNGVKFGKIIVRNGGIENYGLLIKDAVIADMVETGRSLAVNDWRVLGMNDVLAQDIADGNAKFSDLSMEQMSEIPGVMVASRAAFVRAPIKMSAEKEKVLRILGGSFFEAANDMGKRPVLKDKRVALQNGQRRGAGQYFNPALGFPGHLIACGL